MLSERICTGSIAVNRISFLTTVLATISVMGICVYGAVRYFLVRRFSGAIAILMLIPLWFCAQFIAIVVFDELRSHGHAAREYHLDYVATPLANVLGAVLVVYLVLSLSRRLAPPKRGDSESISHVGGGGGAWTWMLEPRRLIGALFVLAGTLAMSALFIISGVLFIIVGISLIMDVRIWRS